MRLKSGQKQVCSVYGVWWSWEWTATLNWVIEGQAHNIRGQSVALPDSQWEEQLFDEVKSSMYLPYLKGVGLAMIGS